MKLIDKYLLREYLTTVTYCLVGLSMFHVLQNLLNQLSKIIKSDADITLILRYYAAILAQTIEYIAPASLMLATLYTLWTMTRHNEITAMRAGGISLYRVMRPFLGVGLAFTLITLGMKETFAPRAYAWARDLSINDFQDPPEKLFHDLARYNSLRKRQWTIEEFDVKNPRTLQGVKVIQEKNDGTRVHEITATTAEWLDGRWWFYSPTILTYNEDDNPSGRPKPMGPAADSVMEMPYTKGERPSDFVSETRLPEHLTVWEIVRYLKSRPDLSKKERKERIFDIHQRLAMPWACLVVTLFAIPAGVKTGRHNALAGIFTTIGFFFAFYALDQIGVFMGKSGMLWPAAAAWLSNGVFFTVGLGMAKHLR